MSDTLKILFITEDYPDLGEPCGGIGTYVSNMAFTLSKRGHEVHVLSCGRDHDVSSYQERGIFIHRRDLKLNFFLRLLRRILKIPRTVGLLQAGLTNYLEYRKLKIGFDVIEFPDTDAEGWLLGFMHPTALVSHFHLPQIIQYPGLNLESKHRETRWPHHLWSYPGKKADVTTSPSRYQVQVMRERGVLGDLDPAILPHPVDLTNSQDLRSIESTPTSALFLGWLGLNKAPEFLVEAIAILRKSQPEARAIFAGDSHGYREGLPYIDWMKQTASDLEGCDFLGFVPHQEVKPLIASCRVLIMTSWFENYPLAALEAMATGRPVIVPETSGIADMVKETNSGSVVPSGDAQALANVLRPYLEDVEYASKLGANARQAIRDLHDPDKIAEQREAVFATAIANFKEATG